MKKQHAALLILLLPLLTGGSCDNKPTACEPNAIRHDVYQPKRWWICKSDGSGEIPYISPMPSDNSVKG